MLVGLRRSLARNQYLETASNPSPQYLYRLMSRRACLPASAVLDPKSKSKIQNERVLRLPPWRIGVRSRKPEVGSQESEEKPSWNQRVGPYSVKRWGARSSIGHRKSAMRKGVTLGSKTKPRAATRRVCNMRSVTVREVRQQFA